MSENPWGTGCRFWLAKSQTSSLRESYHGFAVSESAAQPVSLTLRGRGAGINPPGRFEPLVILDRADSQDEDAPPTSVPTRYFVDHAKTALNYNQSPDICFDVSINPYRGCTHGCSYCFARPFHEYLGLSGGLDFETQIFCKTGLPGLLRKELADRKYRPQTIAMSGVTDCYQPVERELKITRQALEILAEVRNPVDIITKSHLVTRDLDLLGELARHGAARVDISITSLSAETSRKMEPRAASPQRRLDAIARCREAGVPVGILVAPVVPGLTDHEMLPILTAAKEAGAQWAAFVPLRLPGAVQPVFLDWLRREYPDRFDKITHRQEELRQGRLNDPNFHTRFVGHGPFYQAMRDTFHLALRKLGLDGHGPKLSADAFVRPTLANGQMSLFS